MDELKKAFENLNKEKISDEKKQEIFDCIMDTHKKTETFKKKMFSVVVPALAMCVVAVAAIIMPGVLSPKQQASEMVILDRPEDKATEELVQPVSEPKVVSTILLNINMDIEFGLGEDNTVLEVKGLDDDGKRLLAGIDCEGLSFQNAAIVVVNQLLLNDYINSDVNDKQITVSIDSEQLGIETLEVMTDTIKTAAGQHKIDVDVTPSEDSQQLSIDLSNSDIQEQENNAKEQSATTIEFVINQNNKSIVDNVLAYTDENQKLITTIDFADMPFKQAVLFGINDLINQGYISDENVGHIQLKLSVEDENLASGLKYLAQLLINQEGLSLKVANTDDASLFEIVASEQKNEEKRKITMSKILDPTVHKNANELTDTQLEILGLVYTTEQIQELLSIRYWVVVPNLVGLEEQQAVSMLEQMDIVPVVTREYNEEYSTFEEGIVFLQDFGAGAMLEKGDRLTLHVLADSPCPLGENWTPSAYGTLDAGSIATFNTEYEIYDSGTTNIYVVINNLSEQEELAYDANFVIERLYEGEWYTAVCKGCAEPAARVLAVKDTVGEMIDLSSLGTLEDGHYRIIKQLGDIRYSAQFDIKEGGYNSNSLSGYMPLAELPQEYTVELSVANGDFVIDNIGNVYNEDKLIAFLDNVRKGLPCMVRRMMTTIEGDPIIDDFVFTGKYFYVAYDATRDAFGVWEEIEYYNYSYLTLNYSASSTRIELANSYERMPADGGFKNTNNYIMLHDANLVSSADIISMVEDVMDEDAPMKIFSADGSKYISYTKGKRTVKFEVYGEKSYASAIIIPEEYGEVGEMIALEYRDNSVVLITFKTVDGQNIRIAFDIINQEFVELTEEESLGLNTIDEDYFTDADRKLMAEQFVSEANGMSFAVSNAEETASYSISKTEATVNISKQASEDTQPVSIEWNEQKFAEFIKEVVLCNVLDWNNTYNNEDSESQTAWSLNITGEKQNVVSSGIGGYPQEYEQLHSVLQKYFEKQDS